MNWSVKVCLFLLLCVLGSLGTYVYAEDGLSCRVDAGVWDTRGGGLRLLGALCGLEGECEDFYNFDFGKKSITYAQRFRDQQACDLRFLLQSANTLFYSDGNRLYGVDSETLKLNYLEERGEVLAIAKDIEYAMQFGVLIQSDIKRSVLILKVKPSGVEAVLEAEVEGAHSIKWQKDRVVVYGDEVLFWWTRDGDGFEEGKKLELNPKITENNFHIDEAGMMVVSAREPRVVYYRFATADRTVARVNATASVRAISGSDSMAMVLTTDMYVTRLVSRLGTILQNRYEIKYWDLPKDKDEKLFLAHGDKLVLAGASEKQAAMSVATDDITWKRRAIFSIPSSKHSLVYMDNKTLTTLNEESAQTSPVERRDLSTGALVAALSKENLAILRGADPEKAKDEPAFGKIDRLERVGEDSRFDLLYDDAGKIALMRSVDMRVWPKIFLPPKTSQMEASALVESLGIKEFDNGIAAASVVQEGKTSQWYVIQNDEAKELGVAQLYNEAEINDALSAYEKWYGYCIDAKTCVINPVQEGTLEGTRKAFEASILSVNNHKPNLLAYFMAVAALLASIIIPMWRNGTGKKGKVRLVENGAQTNNNMLLLDKQGRRFVTERDKSRFLHRSIFSKLLMRLSLSIIAGLVVGLFVSFRYFYDDSLGIFLTWLFITGVPVAAFAWIILSWDYWNRNYLLRFGRATEGVWFDAATPEQAICYAPEEGKSFRLKRGQWKKVDFVPIILFDPERPHFALQYIGDGSFPLIPKLALAEKCKTASTREAYKQIVVFIFLGICIAFTQFAYHKAYPNPLSVWDMNSLEARALESDSDFVVPCLERCFSSDEACKLQCHQRQLRVILKSAGIELESEPALSPKSLLQIQRDASQTVDDIIATNAADCALLAQQIHEVPIWTQSLSNAFWEVYAKEEIYQSADIAALDEALREKSASYKKLCVDNNSCALRKNSCTAPPSCTGNVAVLKDAVCAFARSIVVRGDDGGGEN
ncbi:MAG: hypothetical protein WC966_04055 [Bradymonadales bacterium]|jgi:hypothetical protein